MGQSCNDLTEVIRRPIEATLNGLEHWHQRGSDYLHLGTGHSSGVCDLISSKFNAVLTSIDGEAFSGDERELGRLLEEPKISRRYVDVCSYLSCARSRHSRRMGYLESRSLQEGKQCHFVSRHRPKRYQLLHEGKSVRQLETPTEHASVEAVRLPSLGSMVKRLTQGDRYMPSYPLICLAAQYSQRVYTKPTGREREAHVEADWRLGTKAMVIKSIPIDDMDAVVFAIRGSQTFMDWAVNLNSAPSSPVNFLVGSVMRYGYVQANIQQDDPGNMCHSGFLAVARKMIKPVAARLRSLLEEDPSRSSCSLIITGHSAGGAVASLLYAHMMADGLRSELSVLTGCKCWLVASLNLYRHDPCADGYNKGFKRIHCITFGAPPVSLLPILKSNNPRYRKSLFLSFINEGDP